MKKYIKPTIELENLQMSSILMESKPVSLTDEGTFDAAHEKSFADLFGTFFN